MSSNSSSQSNRSNDFADARIVKTVRNLQKSVSQKVNNEEELKIKEEREAYNDNDDKDYFEEEKNRTTNELRSSQNKSSINSVRIVIDSNKPYDKKKILSTKEVDKISLGKSKKENQDKILVTNEKNEYQKKLTSQLSIDKYKQMCLQIIKEDEEIRTNLEILKITEVTKFIEEYLFNDLVFQYKLEVFLIQKNGNTKNQKMSFFKQEIKKILDFKLIDIEFDQRMKSINKLLDIRIKTIEAFSVMN